MFALLVLGTLVIIANYLGLLPGEQQNRYLLLGLGLITAGFVLATQSYRGSRPEAAIPGRELTGRIHSCNSPQSCRQACG